MTGPAEKSAKHEKHQKSEKGGLDAVKKVLGLVAAVLSLGTAVYGLLHAQADKRERAAEATESMATGSLQEKAGDYEHAWESYQKAAKLAAADGVFTRLFFGTLSKQQEAAHQAQEELAQKWVREANTLEEQGLADDPAIKLLSADVESATGAHKADLLAHIGYAYFQKAQRPGEQEPAQSATFYREAVAADPQNPYANAFWGQLVLSNHGSIEEVKQHFATALASGREHEWVQQLELGALTDRGEYGDTLWWQVVNGMRKAGEPLKPDVTHDMAGKYYRAAGSQSDRKLLYAAITPAEHAELARYLLQSGGARDNVLSVKVMLAYSLEAAGKQGEALSAWQDVRSTPHEDESDYNTTTQEALKRLGAAKPH